MMNRRGFIILVGFILICSIESAAQNHPDSIRIYRIQTRDGNVFTGNIVREDSVSLTLKTENLGEIKIPQVDVKLKTEINDIKKVGKEYWLPNPQSSRYFWAPNGYGLKKGEAYYQNIWVLYNQASVGITDNFSLGAGMLPLFLFTGPSPIWIIPKFSFPVVKDKFNIGTGAILATVLGSEGSGAFGLLYATTTFGPRDQNVSIGLADGFAGGQWMKFPIVNINALFRTGPRGYFITENYIITAEGSTFALLSAGGRTLIRNIGIDYSLWVPVAGWIGRLIAVPFLGITIPIGKSPQK